MPNQDAKASRSIIGNSLPTAIGKTAIDQRKIDKTVARGCAGNIIYTPAECDAHTKAVAAGA